MRTKSKKLSRSQVCKRPSLRPGVPCDTSQPDANQPISTETVGVLPHAMPGQLNCRSHNRKCVMGLYGSSHNQISETALSKLTIQKPPTSLSSKTESEIKGKHTYCPELRRITRSRSFERPQIKSSNDFKMSKQLEQPNSRKSSATRLKDVASSQTLPRRDLERSREVKHPFSAKHFKTPRSHSVKNSATSKLELPHPLKQLHCTESFRATRSQSVVHQKIPPSTECESCSNDQDTCLNITTDASCTKSTETDIILKSFAPNIEDEGLKCKKTSDVLRIKQTTEPSSTDRINSSEKTRKAEHSHCLKCLRRTRSYCVKRQETADCSEVEYIQCKTLHTPEIELTSRSSGNLKSAQNSDEDGSNHISLTSDQTKKTNLTEHVNIALDTQFKRLKKDRCSSALKSSVDFNQRSRSKSFSLLDAPSLNETNTCTSNSDAQSETQTISNSKRPVTLKETRLKAIMGNGFKMQKSKQKVSSSKKGIPKRKVRKQIAQKRSENVSVCNNAENRHNVGTDLTVNLLPVQLPNANAFGDSSKTEMIKSKVLCFKKKHPLPCLCSNRESMSHTSSSAEDDDEDNDLSCHKLFTYDTEHDDDDSSSPGGASTGNTESLNDSFLNTFKMDSSFLINCVLSSSTDVGGCHDKEPISSTYKTYDRKKNPRHSSDSACQTDFNVNVENAKAFIEAALLRIAKDGSNLSSVKPSQNTVQSASQVHTQDDCFVSDHFENAHISRSGPAGCSIPATGTGGIKIKGKTYFEDTAKNMPVEAEETSYVLKTVNRKLLNDNHQTERNETCCGSIDLFEQEGTEPISEKTSKICKFGAEFFADAMLGLETERSSQYCGHVNLQGQNTDCEQCDEIQIRASSLVSDETKELFLDTNNSQGSLPDYDTSQGSPQDSDISRRLSLDSGKSQDSDISQGLSMASGKSQVSSLYLDKNQRSSLDSDETQRSSLDSDETQRSSLDSDMAQLSSPDSKTTKGSLPICKKLKKSVLVSSLKSEKSKPSAETSSQNSDESSYPNKREQKQRYCFTDMIKCTDVHPRCRRSYYGQQLRGSSGWEESLRQHPAKTKLLQVGSTLDCDKYEGDNFGQKSDCLDRKFSKQILAKKRKTDEMTVLENNQQISSVSETTVKRRRTEVIVLENDQQMNLFTENEANYGQLVWARLAGERWWPGIIIKGSQVYLESDNRNMSWIFWFGDHKVSQIAHEKIMSFADGYSSKFNKKVKKPVVEALQECWRRNNSPSHLDSEEALLKFADAGFKIEKDSKNWSFEPIPGDALPGYILVRLKQIGDDIRDRVASKKGYVAETRHSDSALQAIQTKEKNITDVCISCMELDARVICQHPMFEGGLCQECKELLMETCYAHGEDGLHAYCAVCGNGGKLFICDSLSCNRVYCFSCVDDFCGPEITTNIKDSKSWMCFLCSPFTLTTHGMLKPKPDWEAKIVSFFDTGYRIERPNVEYFKEKRPIRVLSLFDGIGTCKLALDQLGFNIDVYYSSEVDKDALMVTRANHGDAIIQVGDVQLLNYKNQENVQIFVYIHFEEKLPQIGPVDLLIGGSPCNDFSLANPNRKGFGGSGVLFFDFFRVLKYLQINYKDRHLFWLYENVASMKTEYMAHISRFLDCQPALWDSKYFAAQHRARYFWGNIPGLYSTPQISTNLHESVSLNSSLESKCNRQALIPKLRTVTTRGNSLKCGKKDESFPIQMDGIDDGIWIPELERVFGFPSHYTDVGNLPTTRRQKLIGKSWCLPVIKHILSPLKEYFTVQEKS